MTVYLNFNYEVVFRVLLIDTPLHRRIVGPSSRIRLPSRNSGQKSGGVIVVDDRNSHISVSNCEGSV